MEWCSYTWLPFLQYVHYLQRKYSMGSFNLLGHTAPVQATSLLIVGPFLDYWLTDKRVDAYHYTLTSLVISAGHFLFHPLVLIWSLLFNMVLVLTISKDEHGSHLILSCMDHLWILQFRCKSKALMPHEMTDDWIAFCELPLSHFNINNLQSCYGFHTNQWIWSFVVLLMKMKTW